MLKSSVALCSCVTTLPHKLIKEGLQLCRGQNQSAWFVGMTLLVATEIALAMKVVGLVAVVKFATTVVGRDMRTVVLAAIGLPMAIEAGSRMRSLNAWDGSI